MKGRKSESVSFDDADGFTAAVRIFLDESFSAEVGASVVEPEATFGAFGSSRSLGDVRMTPAHATVRVHPWSSERFRPWLGAGAAWIGFDLDNELNETAGVTGLDLSSDWTWIAQAGAQLNLTPRLSAQAEVRWMPVESEFTAVDRLPAAVELEPLFVSLGVAFRFD